MDTFITSNKLYITLITILSIFAIVFKLQIVLYAVVTLAIILSIFSNYSFGIFTFLILYPYFYILEETLGYKPQIVLYGLLVFTIFSFLIRHINILRINKISLLFLVMFIFQITLALLFSRNILSSLQTYLILLFNLFSSIFLYNMLINIVKLDSFIKQLFLILLSTIIVVALTSLEMSRGRIRLGGNVRKIANALSPIIILLFIRIPEENNKRFYFLMLVISLVIIIMTASRGSFLSVFITIIYVTIKRIKFRFKKKHLKYLILVPVIIFFFFKFITEINTLLMDGSLNRVLGDSWIDNPRFDIWFGPLSQLTFLEYFVGSGPGIYRELELLSHRNYYAHSVFVDTLVTLGTLAFSLLIGYLTIIALYIKDKGDLLAKSLFMLTLLLFTTHGTLSGSYDFWIYIVIALALAYKNNEAKTINENYRWRVNE